MHHESIKIIQGVSH